MALDWSAAQADEVLRLAGVVPPWHVHIGGCKYPDQPGTALNNNLHGFCWLFVMEHCTDFCILTSAATACSVGSCQPVSRSERSCRTPLYVHCVWQGNCSSAFTHAASFEMSVHHEQMQSTNFHCTYLAAGCWPRVAQQSLHTHPEGLCGSQYESQQALAPLQHSTPGTMQT